jgi:molecular chaperone GrpE
MGDKKKIKVRKENEISDKKNDSLPDNETAGDARPTADESVEEVQSKLEAAEKEAKENYDRLLRISADFENFKKRTSREMADLRKFANESLIKAMLPVVDNLERALDSANHKQFAGNPIAEGVQMTLSEILNIFEKFNVRQIESLEKPFDPMFHQAVTQQESDDHPDKIVLHELQKGYLMHDRLVRPAMVVVSQKKESVDEQSGKKQKNEKDHT